MNLFVYNSNTLIFSQGTMKSKNSQLTFRTHLPLQLSTLMTNSWRDMETLVQLRGGSKVSGKKLRYRTCALSSCYF